MSSSAPEVIVMQCIFAIQIKNANKISGINGEINIYKFGIKNIEISLSLPNNLNCEINIYNLSISLYVGPTAV